MNSSNDTQPLVLINTGGTFNKRYNPLNGELEVARDNTAVRALLTSALPNLATHELGLFYKDSLQMTDADRAELIHVLRTLPALIRQAPVLIVHGTDTLDQTAAALDQAQLDRVIILTGAMRPAEIDPAEAALHLGLALGFIAALPPQGVYIAMHGLVRSHQHLRKDRMRGIFRPPHQN